MHWRTFFSLLSALLIACQSLHAGAWPRGKGKVFASASGIFSWPQGRAIELPDIYGSGYAEFGLGQRLTLGLDLGSSDATLVSKLKAVAFVRYSLSDADARHQFALDIGGGQYLGNPVLRMGGSYGTGLQFGKLSGWYSMDVHSLINPNTRASTQNLDASLGVNLSKSKLIGSFSAHRSDTGKRTFTLTPSYAYQINKSQTIEMGIVFDLKRTSDPKLKLGVWQEF
ncbi:hypothetical protein [Planktotalea sp.]|uniref:hypothetical protein n=1 Tax=Planktotalea sp. TaxID=2029877 RepID=UPI003D6A0BED